MDRMYKGSTFGKKGATPGTDGRGTVHRNGIPAGASANTRKGLSGGASEGKKIATHQATSSNTRRGLAGPGAKQGKLIRQPS